MEVRVVFLKIGEIDTLKEMYRADAFIQTKWPEPRLNGKTPEVRYVHSFGMNCQIQFVSKYVAIFSFFHWLIE